MPVYDFPPLKDNLPGAQRRRVGIRGNFINADLKDDTPSQHLTDTERATALPIVEAKVEEFAANLPPKAKALIVSAAMQDPRLAEQMRTGGISFSSTIVQNAVKSAMADVQSGKITEANIHSRGGDPNASDETGGHKGPRPNALTALEMLRLAALRERSSAHYNGMDGERLTQGDLQNMASARAAAISYGMSWALNSPELLKLGPTAIKTLHDAGVKQATFERMTSDEVGIRAKTAVNFAAWAKRKNLTPEETNRLMDRASDLHESLTRYLPPDEKRRAQRELNEALNKYVTGPDTPEARKALEDTYKRLATTPEQIAASEAHVKALADAKAKTDADVVTRDGKVVKADAKEVNADAVMDATRAKRLEIEARMAALEGGAAPGTGTSGETKRADADTVNPAEQQPPAVTTVADKKGTTQQADGKPTGTTQVAAAKPTAPAGPKV